MSQQRKPDGNRQRDERTALLESVLQARSDILWREVDGEIVALDPHRGYYYGIEGAGMRIWELLQRPTTFQTLLRILRDEYNVEEQQLRADLVSMCERLERCHLIEQCS